MGYIYNGYARATYIAGLRYRVVLATVTLGRVPLHVRQGCYYRIIVLLAVCMYRHIIIIIIIIVSFRSSSIVVVVRRRALLRKPIHYYHYYNNYILHTHTCSIHHIVRVLYTYPRERSVSNTASTTVVRCCCCRRSSRAHARNGRQTERGRDPHRRSELGVVSRRVSTNSNPLVRHAGRVEWWVSSPRTGPRQRRGRR